MPEMLDTMPANPLLETLPDGDAMAKPACANLQGIVRRGVAFALDVIPFVVVAEIVALAFPGAVVTAYPYSRLAALPLVVLFRAAFQATAGRTPGQRLLGLRVAQRDGRPPAFGRAVARNAIAMLPMVMNGFAPPGVPLGFAPWAVFSTVAIFGVGLGSTYLLVLNRATRQALHDLATGTFVWYGPGSLASPPSRSFPLVHAGVLVLLSLVFMGVPLVGLRLFAPGDAMQPLMALRDDVHATGRYQDVGVSLETTFTPQGSARILRVTLVGRFDQAELEAQARDVTALVRARSSALPPVDRLVVQKMEAYDLFFVSGTRSEWKTVPLAAEPAPSPGGGT
jgi:uncharacterized RDD family membrane protein YckC